MVELAETLQAPVQGGGRNMPNRHPLSGGGAVGNADVILALQVDDLWGTLNNFRDQQERSSRSLIRPAAKVLSISSGDLYMKSNYQDFQRFAEVDIAIAADGQATLPSLIEACKRLITADRRRAMDDRGKTDRGGERTEPRARPHRGELRRGTPARSARHASAAEMWDAVKNKDWALVGGGGSRLWNIDKFYQTTRRRRGGGVGSGLPTAVGAALAHKKSRPVVHRHAERRRPDVRAGRAVDGRPSPDSDAARDAQQPRVSPGGHAHSANGEPAPARHHQRGHRHDDRQIRTSTTRRSRAAWACTARGRSRIRRISARRSGAPWQRVERGETALVDVVTQPR